MPEREGATDTINFANFGDYLYSRAKQVVWPLTFTADCEREFLNVLTAAVRRMESEGFAEDYEKFAEVEQTVEELAQQIKRRAEEEDLSEIDKRTLWKTLREWCPVWPIC